MILNKERWIENLLVAHVVMTEMPDEAIYPNLRTWCMNSNDCGSPACFGGWVGRIPFFNNQGVFVNTFGAPYVRRDCGLDASTHLFGEFLFSERTHYENYGLGYQGISDRKLILKRIEKRMLDIFRE